MEIAPPCSIAQSNSFFLAAFLHWSSSVYLYLSCKLLFSHCLLVRRLFTSPPLCPFQVRASDGARAAGSSRPQREQEMPSDSPPAQIGCLIWSRWILANGLWGSRWNQRSLIFFTYYLSHVLLSVQRD